MSQKNGLTSSRYESNYEKSRKGLFVMVFDKDFTILNDKGRARVSEGD